MIENDGPEAIAELAPTSYTHYSGKPATPGVHERLFVPQTIGDGWECWCSCGEWRCFATFYEFATPDDIRMVLEAKHRNHIHLKKLGY